MWNLCSGVHRILDDFEVNRFVCYCYSWKGRGMLRLLSVITSRHFSSTYSHSRFSTFTTSQENVTDFLRFLVKYPPVSLSFCKRHKTLLFCMFNRNFMHPFLWFYCVPLLCVYDMYFSLFFLLPHIVPHTVKSIVVGNWC